jgi:hypothetical protein
MHHIIADGWSMGILFRELTALYNAFEAGQASPLIELPVQYPDFAVWQQKHLGGQADIKDLAYWRERLADAPQLQTLPLARKRPERPGLAGDRLNFLLSPELTTALNSLGREEGVTLFMLLLTAFKAVVYCYTGEEDVIVGSDVANRNREELEHLIGFFVNQVVLRTDLSPSNEGESPRFRELLARVRENTLEAYSHQELPFDQLVSALKPERIPNTSPLFQMKLVLQNAPISPVELPDLVLAPMESAAGAAKFDLLLDLTESQSAILGSLDFKNDLYDRSTITRLWHGYERVLEQVTLDPDITLLELKQRLEEAEQREREKDLADLKSARKKLFSKVKRGGRASKAGGK